MNLDAQLPLRLLDLNVRLRISKKKPLAEDIFPMRFMALSYFGQSMKTRTHTHDQFKLLGRVLWAISIRAGYRIRNNKPGATRLLHALSALSQLSGQS